MKIEEQILQMNPSALFIFIIISLRQTNQIMCRSSVAHQVVVADQEGLGSAAADWDYSAGP